MECDSTDVCNLKVFRCKEQGCIDLQKRCDGNNDCDDASDELGCLLTYDPLTVTPESDRLSSQLFMCELIADSNSTDANQMMINHWQVCDGSVDCPGGEDERNCQNFPMGQSCLPLTISRTQACREDSEYLAIPCSTGSVLLKDGRCVEKSKRCLPNNGSTYQQDLSNGCIFSEFRDPFEDELKSSLYECRNGFYIPVSKMCDNSEDCENGSDERGCRFFSPSSTCPQSFISPLGIAATASTILASFLFMILLRHWSVPERHPIALYRAVHLFGLAAASGSLVHGRGELNFATFSGVFWTAQSIMGLFNLPSSFFDIKIYIDRSTNTDGVSDSSTSTGYDNSALSSIPASSNTGSSFYFEREIPMPPVAPN